ncbi:TIGR01212 family radical SAM protein [Helicobacter cholecystus]|uniref:TIGR01212 family radical SAM protein n=1 Tax=Helicobacter cholecystus TaxID=45498 RepID=UPI002739547A|nr:TIGR01212 family radical SAM protein [Helicobacter cholecystus]
MRELLTLGRYFKKTFGERVRKIPITLEGFTCPNIDGKVARGGCIYCCNESFSPSIIKLTPQTKSVKMNFSLEQNPILQRQILQLKEQFFWHTDFHKEKFSIGKYMIYFQSYTNTYAPLSTLQALYDEAFSLPNVVGMSIGTRVDSVNSEILDLLEGYVKKGFEIWLEYGVQSVFPQTLKLINRGEDMSDASRIFEETRKRGIKVCAHLIYGLPNESKKMILESLCKVLQWGVDGLKLHPLYVVEGTQLAKMYKKGEYTPITLEAYADLILNSIELIPDDVVLQRISSGAHHDTLLAPKWCFDKNIQMRYIRDKLRERGIEY